MFTGLITAVGTVRRVTTTQDRLHMTIAAPYEDLAIGESIAVEGVCLTVVDVSDDSFAVDIITTTRGRTRLPAFHEGDEVNLERALAVGDRLGGHFVQGHVDGLGDVTAVHDAEDARLVDVRVPSVLAPLCVAHGSIALNGVSLTINAQPEPDIVQVALIPHTREVTTLGKLTIGDQVHVEGDMLGKFVHRLLDKDE